MTDAVSAPQTAPVSDWATDYDIFDADYVADPYPIWAELRRECPVASTDRWGGSFLPTRYADAHLVASPDPAPVLTKEHGQARALHSRSLWSTHRWVCC